MRIIKNLINKFINKDLEVKVKESPCKYKKFLGKIPQYGIVKTYSNGTCFNNGISYKKAYKTVPATRKTESFYQGGKYLYTKVTVYNQNGVLKEYISHEEKGKK